MIPAMIVAASTAAVAAVAVAVAVVIVVALITLIYIVPRGGRRHQGSSNRSWPCLALELSRGAEANRLGPDTDRRHLGGSGDSTGETP
jgi:hypothetical protein